ncbi:MAG TPA: N,N-dimethylformamidase beta subunit family domain-containing protein [Gaiellaceae bacterium]|jgi:hypothetical protein
MSWSGTRGRLLAVGGTAFAGLLGLGGRALGATRLLGGLQITNGGRPFAGDGHSLATLGPTRPTARVHFSLGRRSRVTLDVLETGQGVASELPAAGAQTAIGEQSVTLGPGPHQLNWTPAATMPARTYVLRVTAQNGAHVERAHVVARVLGVDAAFGSRSARPTDALPLVVASDAKTLTVQMIRSGPESFPTYVNNVINGVPVGDPMVIDWSANPNAPAPIPISIPGDWQSGVYAAQITADDGRVGFAPLVIRPLNPISRVAAMVPTSTWGAYNFFDANGDGWGDTWYAHWKTNQSDLTRPHSTRGVPYRYRSYDLAFYQWLAQTGTVVDMYADEDIERFATPHDLRAAYDLIVFPGHTEYVTSRMYTTIEAFRDLGGNLLFMSANNFFRRVDRPESTLTLINEWRELGRPEAALCGVQYLASDRGQRRAPFTVVGADAAPWAFAGTGWHNGSQFGIYGIEIDARAESSPETVQVLCNIPDLFGAGRTAEMTYYEHWSGAKVFSAGVLDFGGKILLWRGARKLFENVWQRLA